MSNLPEEILFYEVLPRLPVKSLLRFNCVSKSWRSLITSSQFSNLHIKYQTSKSEDNLSLLILGASETKSVDWIGGCRSTMIFNHTHMYTKICDTNEDGAVEIYYPLPDPFNFIEILCGSCNGLFCISVGSRAAETCLWNPSTGEYRILPPLPTEINYQSTRSVYGFGCDRSGVDYKVVRMIYIGEGLETETFVYSLNNNLWGNIVSFPYKGCYLSGESTYLNGAINWIARTEDKSIISVVSFDVKNEEFQVIVDACYLGELLHADTRELNYGDYIFNKRLGALKGCLCIHDRSYTLNSVVFIMKDYEVKKSWCKLYTTNLEENSYSVPYSSRYRGSKLLHYSKDCEMLSRDGVSYMCGLNLSDTMHKKARKLEICGVPKFVDVTTYVGSLVSLHTGTYSSYNEFLDIKRAKIVKLQSHKEHYPGYGNNFLHKKVQRIVSKVGEMDENGKYTSIFEVYGHGFPSLYLLLYFGLWDSSHFYYCSMKKVFANVLSV